MFPSIFSEREINGEESRGERGKSEEREEKMGQREVMLKEEKNK